MVFVVLFLVFFLVVFIVVVVVLAQTELFPNAGDAPLVNDEEHVDSGDRLSRQLRRGDTQLSLSLTFTVIFIFAFVLRVTRA